MTARLGKNGNNLAAVPGPARDDAADAAFLPVAAAAAARCGVTRLADVTGLDRLGLPVWQCVRPGSRSLAVHQGKGTSPVAAQIGALCEAIEADCGERVEADGPTCAFAALPADARAPELADYARVREAPPTADAALRWCDARDLGSGGLVHLPFELVSLDYTFAVPSPFERASNGIGAGPDEDWAILAGLLELLERDALGAWERRALADKVASGIRLETVPYGWFAEWHDRLRALAIDLNLYGLHSIVGLPTFRCSVGAEGSFGWRYRRFIGSAAHPDPERALFAALAEALQSRLTFIAGTRDDFLPSFYGETGHVRAPDPVMDWPEPAPFEGGLAALVEGLGGRGYRQIAVKRLDRGLTGVSVVKTFVPGLGSGSRTRRATS